MSLNDLDDYLFPLEANSLYLEPPLPYCVETPFSNHMEPQIPIPLLEPSNLMYPINSTNEQTAGATMPTPSLAPPVDTYLDATIGSTWVDPFDPTEQEYWSFIDQNILAQLEEVPPPPPPPPPSKQEANKEETLESTWSPRGGGGGGGSSLELRMPIDMDLTKLCSNLSSASKELRSHDPEALKYFLAGTVRPGPDVVHIYKCEVCHLEFPNAQAFGGHMSSHSKKRERGNLSKKPKSRGRKRAYRSTTNVREGN